MRGYARECLRSATRSLHAALDARLALPTRVSREGYARYLLTNWPFSSIERGLEEAGVELFLPDWKHRRRRFDLSHDLKRLDVDPPACPSLRIASDRGTILGWTYVLEGSALDPRSSCKLSRRRGRPRIRDSTRFLRHGLGASLWTSFNTVLRQIVDDPAAVAKASEAARNAFECFANAKFRRFHALQNLPSGRPLPLVLYLCALRSCSRQSPRHAFRRGY